MTDITELEMQNDELRQRLANAEHQLHMKDLVIHNIKASRRAQFRKLRATEVQNSELRAQIAALTADANALRAEGVERLADFCATFNNGHEIHPDIDEIRGFAARLREGK